MNARPIITPETHPDHHVVGRDFMGHDSYVYRCDSYDPRCGYWMTRTGTATRVTLSPDEARRTNVSERAMGGTFHEIREVNGHRWCTWDYLSRLKEPAKSAVAK